MRAALAATVPGVHLELVGEHAKRAGDEADGAVGVLARAAARDLGCPALQVRLGGPCCGTGRELLDGIRDCG